MPKLRLNDGREVLVDERTAKMLVRAEKGHYVAAAPEAAVLRPVVNYARRHPVGHEVGR